MNHPIRNVVLGGLFALAVAGMARAGPLEDAHAAVDKGDYVTAEHLLRPLAEQGDAKAENNLGVLYRQGWGVPPDAAIAVGWFGKSAAQGFGPAELNLGVAYENGQGAPKDFAAAASWYGKAAAQGLPAAAYNLAGLYHLGEGVKQDDAQAANWLRQAAEKGLPPAQYNLGLLYTGGVGVPKDLVQARMWFVVLLTHLPANDTEHRAQLTQSSQTVAAQMTPAQIAESDRLAAAWVAK